MNEKLLLKYQLNVIIDKLNSIDTKINNIETNKNFTYNYFKNIYDLISKIWNKMYTTCTRANN